MPDSLPAYGDTIIVDMARKFAQERLAPLAAEREKAGRIEPEIIRELGELGLFGATTPTEWDGSDIDPVTYALLLEEIAAGDGSVSTMVSVHNSPTCIVIANSGTDASNLRTRAVKRGDKYIVNGSKQFISNAMHPGSLVFFAVTDPTAGKRGISCFVIDKNHPGFSVVRTEAKLGQKASDTCALSFQDVEIPEDQRIGAEGEGYKIALSTLESGRIGIAAQSVGMARSALDYAIGYARERTAFGGKIIDFQAVGFRLVEAKTRL